MSETEPATADRLKQAAYELFFERSFADVTVAEIADRAGVSRRTFFRHFDTKEDVVFTASAEVSVEIMNAVRFATDGMQPIEYARAASNHLAKIFQDTREFHRQRHVMIAGSSVLRERQLLLEMEWSKVAARTMVERGIPRVDAQLAASIGLTAFQYAYEEWLTDHEPTTLLQRNVDALENIARMVSGVAVYTTA